MQNEKSKFFFWFKIMVSAALLTLGVIYFKSIWKVVKDCFSIIAPFLAGGIIAFILNIPMSGIENLLFGKAKKKFWLKVKRPISIILTILLGCILVALLILSVVPQVVETVNELKIRIPIFYHSSLDWIEKMLKEYPQVAKTVQDELSKLENAKIDWEKTLTNISNFFMNGVGGSFIKSTFSMAGKIGGGIFNAVIAAIFSIYILAQKEKLGYQVKRILSAFASEKLYRGTMKVVTLLSDNFSKFIAGQCLEAVILGLMTAAAMLIFRFDYIVLVGVLVAFTALIPVVGGFIGCGVGAFLFLMEDPMKAVWFIVLFLIVQQIEGNLVYPHVVGGSVGLPSMWVLAAITIGGSLLGVAGMLFFIPLTSTVYALLREITNQKNEQKIWTTQALSESFSQKLEEEQSKTRKKGIFSFKRKKKDKVNEDKNKENDVK